MQQLLQIRGYWFIFFYENETFSSHFSQKWDLFGSFFPENETFLVHFFLKIRPFWLIFQRKETFLVHFPQKWYLFASFFMKIRPIWVIFHENDTVLSQFSLKWDLTITLAPIFFSKNRSFFFICCNTVSTDENKVPIF